MGVAEFEFDGEVEAVEITLVAAVPLLVMDVRCSRSRFVRVVDSDEVDTEVFEDEDVDFPLCVDAEEDEEDDFFFSPRSECELDARDEIWGSGS